MWSATPYKQAQHLPIGACSLHSVTEFENVQADGGGMETSPRGRIEMGRNRLLAVTLALGAVLMILGGCETLRGAGRDLQAAGDRMSNIVNRVNFLW